MHACQAAIQREVEKLKEATGTKPKRDIIMTMWCVDRGDGKSGFARFSIFNPKEKTPLSDEEVKEMRKNYPKKRKMENRESSFRLE